MIQLTTFGGPQLLDALGQPIDAIIAQPRRLALLTYLALESRKAPLRRDVIIGIFWPEVSQARASRSLSQAVHYLRKALGDDALSEPRREDVRVNARAVACDASAFMAAFESQQFADALDLYRGDFLRGFHLGEVADFEDWAEEQRGCMRRMATEAALIEARRAARSGNAFLAANNARRATELGLFAEPLVREQMELLDSIGDTAGALEAYMQLRRRLQRDLDGDPAPETDAVAERLRKKRVTEVPVMVPATSPPEAPVPVASPGRPKRRWRPRLAVAGVSALTLTATIPLWGLREAEPSADGAAAFWVEDLEENDAPPGVAKALTADIIDKLSAITGVTTRHVSARNEEGIESKQEPVVVRGTISRAPWLKGYSVTITLTGGMTGNGVGVREFRYDGAPLARTRRIADDIVDFARVETGRYYKTKAIASLSPENAEIVRLAQAFRVRGDSLFGDGQAQPALAAFRQADSLFAQLKGGGRTASVAYTKRADVWLSRAWVFLTPAVFSLDQFRRSAAHALLLTDSALEADYRYAETQEVRGQALQLLWQMLPSDSVQQLRGFLEMAEQALTTAVDIAPARARSWKLLSAVYEAQGRFDDALAAAERSYAADAFLEQSPEVLFRMHTAALETGDPVSARKWCDEIGRRFSGSSIVTDCRLQTLAWSRPTLAEYRAASALLEKHNGEGTHAPVMVARLAMLLGVVAARAGMPLDSAFAIQNRALAQSSHHPELTPLRAWLWQTVNHADSARALIRRYVTEDPVRRAGILKSRRFQSEPEIATNQPAQ